MAESTFESSNLPNTKCLRENNPDEFSLYHVLGMTSSSPNGLSANEVSDQVAFPAACILVLLSPRTGEQRYIQTPSLIQNISCVTFSKEGRLIAFIESGVNPYLSVWLVKEAKPVNNFKVGNSGKLAFHPHKPFIVVIGSLFKDISVYDYFRGSKVAYSRWTTAPLAMCVPSDGKSVIVSGHRKITYFSLQGVDSMARSINILESKRCFSLGRLFEHTFVDIICGKRKHRKALYSVTSSGYVCKLKMDILEKYEKIDSSLTCVEYGLDLLFVGCPESIVKICCPDSLSVVALISLSESIGHKVRPKPFTKVETSGIVVSDRYNIITSVFSDSSIYSWQVMRTEEGIKYSFILPSYYKHCRQQGSKEDSLGKQLHRAELIRQFVCVTSQNVFKKDNPHGSYAATQSQGDPKIMGRSMNAVRISPDGKDIVSGDENGDIKVHDANTFITRRVIEAHMSQVTYVDIMYDADYKLICTGGRDRVIFILDAANDFSLVQVLCDHSAAITAISLVRCSGTLSLVSSAADGVILIRTALASPKPQFQITGQVPCSLGKHTFTCSSQVLATGSRNGVIHLFKTDAITINEPELVIQDIKSATSDDGLETLEIDPSGSFLAVGCCSGHTTLYHLPTGNVVTTLTNQKGLAHIKFTPDMQYMICQSVQLKRIGCALVWRLPERMTDYMRFKVDKHCETSSSKAKYDSLVKYFTDTDTSYSLSTSTPTIKSMNFMKGSLSSISSDYSRVYASSSDCSSISTTTATPGCHYSTSDASIKINSMPIVSAVNVRESSSRESRKDKNHVPTIKKRRIRRSNTCDGINKQRESLIVGKLTRYNSSLPYSSNLEPENVSSVDTNKGERTAVKPQKSINENIQAIYANESENGIQFTKSPSSPSVDLQRTSHKRKSTSGVSLCDPQKKNEGIFDIDSTHVEKEDTILSNVTNLSSAGEDVECYVKQISYEKNMENTLKQLSDNVIPDGIQEDSGTYPVTERPNLMDTMKAGGGDQHFSINDIQRNSEHEESNHEKATSQKTLTDCLMTTDAINNNLPVPEIHDTPEKRAEEIIKAMQLLIATRNNSEESRSSTDKSDGEELTNATQPQIFTGKSDDEASGKISDSGFATNRETESATTRGTDSFSVEFLQGKQNKDSTSRESSTTNRLNSIGYRVVTGGTCEQLKQNSSNSNLMDLPDKVLPPPSANMAASNIKSSEAVNVQESESDCTYTTCSTHPLTDEIGFTAKREQQTILQHKISNQTTAPSNRLQSQNDIEAKKAQVSSFFKQNEYLQRLKDIRTTFEKNIEALKRERLLSEQGLHP